jgi:phenylacetate-CoA ligase
VNDPDTDPAQVAARAESDPSWRGVDPHARGGIRVARAYLRAAFKVAPEIFLVPWLSRASVRQLALRRFRALVEHAIREVPYYRNTYREAGVRPSDLVDEAALDRVPVLTKSLLANRIDEIQPPKEIRRHLLRRNSSGSSGTAAVIYFDPLTELPRRMQELRFLTSHGIRPWHVQLIFDRFDYRVPKKFLVQKLGVWRREVFPWADEPRKAVHYVDQLAPDVLHGMLSNVRLFALAAREHGMRHRPRLVVTKGELLDPPTRRLIESTFGAPIADYYTTEEAGIIAWECPAGSGYHVDQDLVYLEIVGPDGKLVPPGTPGEIVYTNLYMKTMPIIRYRSGDLGVLSADPCPCGRGLPLLRELHGRKIDMLMTPDGMLIHPFGPIVVMENVREVHQFRLDQVAEDRLIVRVNWHADTSLEERARARENIVSSIGVVVGPSLVVEVEDAAPFMEAYNHKTRIVRGRPTATIDSLTAATAARKKGS